MRLSFPLMQSPQPAHHIEYELLYVVMRRDGGCWSFQSLDGARNKTHFTSFSNMAQYRSACVFQFIDPITAIWMGLVSLEDLGLTEQTMAVLKLTMEDLK